MHKLESLRAALASACPALASSPERLVVQATRGTIVGTGGTSDSFEYRYTAQVLVTDLTDHPDTVVVPVMRWARLNQPDLFFNPTKRESGPIRFEAEILSNRAADLLVEIDLTERVVVTGTAAAWQATHAPEPPDDPADPTPADPPLVVIGPPDPSP